LQLGHAYFVLKDEHAQVLAYVRQRKQNLEWTPRDGMQIEVQALVSLYERAAISSSMSKPCGAQASAPVRGLP